MAHAAINWVINEIPYPPTVKPAARWLLVQIADRANKDDWTCYPSHKTLAKDAGMSSRSVLSLLSLLEEHGIIKRTERFRDNGTRSTDLITISRSEELAERAEDSWPDRPQTMHGQSAKAATHNLVSEPGKKTSVVKARESEPDAFEMWWPHYPRRVAKAAAVRPFWKALSTFKCDTPLTALIEATDRFAVEVKGREIEKIPHPATWLNGERWTDEPEANGGPIDGRGRGLPPSHSGTRPSASEQHAERVGAMLSGAMAAVDRRKRWGFRD